MIDVIFFLLVTFMLASLAMQSLNSVTVNLPKGRAEAIKHKEPVTLTVTQGKQLYLDKTAVTLDSLPFVLKRMLAGQDPGLVVNADAAAPEGVVVQAMLAARRAGVEHFQIAVKRE